MDSSVSHPSCISTGAVSEDEERAIRKKDIAKKKDKKEKKDKGYKMFEEEDSEEELVFDDSKSPSKMKKHSKPSFKFAKKEKFYKTKEKDQSKEKEDRKDKLKLKVKKPVIGITKERDISDSALQVFGVPLVESVERSKCYDGIQLPIIFRECIDYIEEYGLSCEGIYRISGVKSKVQSLKHAYNRNEPVNLRDYEPNVVASLLKQYLRELPEPVLTAELTPKFEQASTIKNVRQKVVQFLQLINELPAPNRLLVSWTMVHMTHVIAKETQNKMSLQNVSIVLSPSMQISHRVLNVLFTYSKILFRETSLKKYVPPIRPCTSRWSLDLPESPSALEEELHKQELMLNQLHEDLMKKKDAHKEEQVWEVQRVVTGLKRKIKAVKKSHENATLSPNDYDKGKVIDSQSGLELDTVQEVSENNDSNQDVVDSVNTISESNIESNEEVPSKLEEVNSENVNEDEISDDDKTPEPLETTEHYSTDDDSREELDAEIEQFTQQGIKSRQHISQAKNVAQDASPVIKAPPVVPESAQQILEDFIQIKAEDGSKEDPEMAHLLRLYNMYQLEEEELLAIGNEYKAKISTEQGEIERLHQEIAELQAIRDEEELSSDDASSISSSSSESGDEDELLEEYYQLMKENELLEANNADLCQKIHQERQICLAVKVEIRMIQQKQLEERETQLAAERDALMIF